MRRNVEPRPVSRSTTIVGDGYRSQRPAGSPLRTLRTTNPLENLNREFRRRTKTQASFGTEAAAVTLLWGLIAFGQIRMRRSGGYQHLSTIIDPREDLAA